MQQPEYILHVAVPSPLRCLFDYLPPSGCDAATIQPGMRVEIPFGRGKRIGIIVAVDADTDIDIKRLKPVKAILDSQPLIDKHRLALGQWAWSYYQHPPGEVMAALMPALLRQGQPATPRTLSCYFLTEAGKSADPEQLRRAPKQQALLIQLQQAGSGLHAHELQDASHAALKALVDKGLAEVRESPDSGTLQAHKLTSHLALNPGQQQAVDDICASFGQFQSHLLYGVTGSGKTEVYLQCIESVLERDQQVLVLVPEIGLTPQLLERFKQRFDTRISVLHSGLNDTERHNAWLAARAGKAGIVIGTRSAIFSPLPGIGLVIIDEEHDSSLKQQEGFRYSARDLALVLARDLNIPVILGSATPSLESLHNARQGRYRLLELPERIGQTHPPITLLDVRGQLMDEGLSAELQQRIRRHLDNNQQVMLFLNRRGFAPTLLCHDCGHVAVCHRCDAHMTYHQRSGRLRCHHCGHEQTVPPACPACGSVDLRAVGHGTERLEKNLQSLFPDTPVLRIDRDSTRKKGSLQQLLQQASEGQRQILLGTQMLAKGHHFPNVTLVALIDTDQGLFGADFRSAERLAQLVLQVAGRAGRADAPGEVVIQTHHPEHPLLQSLTAADYTRVAEAALQEREMTQFPPFSHLALLRAESPAADQPLAFLYEALQQVHPEQPVQCLGPVPAPMERRAGRYRAQLLIQAEKRDQLHRFLGQWLPLLDQLKSARKVRWSIDVDPQDMY